MDEGQHGASRSGRGALTAHRWGAWAHFVQVLALLVAMIRFVRLGDWSLWLDEVLGWGDTGEGVSNPLGYWIIDWTVSALGTGPTEAALRLAPAVFGFLCVPLTIWTFLPLAGPRRAALAGLLVAASSWQVQWAQTARFYTMTQFVCLLGAGIAIRGLLAGGAVRWVLGAAIAGSSTFFHAHGAILALALGLGGLLMSPAAPSDARRVLLRITALLAVLGLLISPWIYQRVWAPYAEQKPVSDALSGVSHFVLASVSSFTPTLLALALGGVLMGWRGGGRRVGFVAFVAVSNLLLLCAMSTQATVTAQYAFSVFPWVALLAAWPVGDHTVGNVAAADAARLRRGFVVSWSAVGLVPLLAGAFLYMTVEHGQRARWKEAVEFVEERRDPTDLVVATPAVVVEFYLTGAVETDVRRTDAVMQLDRFFPDRLEVWQRSGRDAWIIVRNDYLLRMRSQDRAELRRLLSEECRHVKRFPVHALGRDLSLDVWRMGE